MQPHAFFEMVRVLLDAKGCEKMLEDRHSKRKTVAVTSTKLHKWMPTRSAVRNGVFKASYPDILSTSWHTKYPKMIGTENSNIGDNSDNRSALPCQDAHRKQHWLGGKPCWPDNEKELHIAKPIRLECEENHIIRPQRVMAAKYPSVFSWKSMCCLVERMRPQQYQAPCSSHEVPETTSLRHWRPAEKTLQTWEIANIANHVHHQVFERRIGTSKSGWQACHTSADRQPLAKMFPQRQFLVSATVAVTIWRLFF